MSKISKFLFLTLFLPSLVYSEEFVYVCREDSDSGFILNFKINTLSKTIIHTTSLGTDSPLTRFEVNREEEIIYWEYPKTVFSYDREDYHQYRPRTRYFNFEIGTMFQSVSLTGSKNQMLFYCVKS